MLKYLFLALIPVFIGFVFSLLRPRPAVQLLAASQALQKLNAGAVLLDVREPAAGHVRGAVNVPLAELRERAPALAPDKDAPVLVCCATGRRSADAAARLAKMGYTDVSDCGGMDQWPYPLER